MTTHQETEPTSFQQQIEVTKPAAETEEQLIKQAVLRLNGNILGLVQGIICALVIFIATVWLVLKGGEVVGPHLGLLSQFFPGYSVTFTGSLIGAAYGFVTGYLGGLLIGWIYNTAVFLKSPKTKR
jgi:hypothetical protein